MMQSKSLNSTVFGFMFSLLLQNKINKIRTTMNVREIAVIGAGPCGAGLTKALVGEKAFSKIKVFERRDRFGGLWNYSGDKNFEISVPSTDPSKKSSRIESPIYKYLDANVPKDLMAYRGFPFGDDVPLFPKHEQILRYVQHYSRDIEQYVSFSDEVRRVEWVEDLRKWQVESAKSTGLFDAVAVAVGSYDHPMVPSITGLKEWADKFPGSVMHAKAYDEPAQFADVQGEILIVGNSASGADIAYQLATTLDRKIYKSVRSENQLPAGADDRIVDVADLKAFDSGTKTVLLQDGSHLANVDRIVFATGYLKSIPFLKTDPPLITDGAKVHGLYKHLVSIANPTLAVIGLPRFVLPTRLSETQGCWLARVWSGRIKLPTKQEMAAEEQASVDLSAEERKHHDLPFPKDVEYSNELNRQILAAPGDYGYVPVIWDAQQTKIRSAVKQIKEGYIKYVREHGKPAYSLRELDGYFQYPDQADSK